MPWNTPATMLPAPWADEVLGLVLRRAVLVGEPGRHAGALDQSDERQRKCGNRARRGFRTTRAAWGAAAIEGHRRCRGRAGSRGRTTRRPRQPPTRRRRQRPGPVARAESAEATTMRTTVTTPTVSVGSVDLPEVEQQVERLGDAIPAVGLVAGEVVELAQHDVDADGRDEAGHHRGRHETQEGAELEQPRDDHDHAGQHGQGEERPSRILAPVEIDVGDDDGHGPGPLDRHERRAGEQGTTGDAEEVGVQPGYGVDAGQQPAGQAVRHALDAQDQAGHGVLPHRLAAEEGARIGDRKAHREVRSGPGRRRAPNLPDEVNRRQGWGRVRTPTMQRGFGRGCWLRRGRWRRGVRSTATVPAPGGHPTGRGGSPGTRPR